MGFFARYFAPETESLRNRMSDTETRFHLILAQTSSFKAERDALKEECDELKAELKAEIKAARKREAKFVNIILKQAGVGQVPEPETVADKDAESPGAETASAATDNLLQQRCADYCERQYGAGYTKADYDAVFEAMKLNPDYWQTDDNDI